MHITYGETFFHLLRSRHHVFQHEKDDRKRVYYTCTIVLEAALMHSELLHLEHPEEQHQGTLLLLMHSQLKYSTVHVVTLIETRK